jgi:hypothetical protein
MFEYVNMQKHFLFASNFEHVNSVIKRKYSQKNYDNPNYYASLVIFQTYKNVVLRIVHSIFGWLYLLCFYSYVIFKEKFNLELKMKENVASFIVY